MEAGVETCGEDSSVRRTGDIPRELPHSAEANDGEVGTLLRKRRLGELNAWAAGCTSDGDVRAMVRKVSTSLRRRSKFMSFRREFSSIKVRIVLVACCASPVSSPPGTPLMGKWGFEIVLARDEVGGPSN